MRKLVRKDMQTIFLLHLLKRNLFNPFNSYSWLLAKKSTVLNQLWNQRYVSWSVIFATVHVLLEAFFDTLSRDNVQNSQVNLFYMTGLAASLSRPMCRQSGPTCVAVHGSQGPVRCLGHRPLWGDGSHHCRQSPEVTGQASYHWWVLYNTDLYQWSRGLLLVSTVQFWLMPTVQRANTGEYCTILASI